MSTTTTPLSFQDIYCSLCKIFWKKTNKKYSKFWKISFDGKKIGKRNMEVCGQQIWQESISKRSCCNWIVFRKRGFYFFKRVSKIKCLNFCALFSKNHSKIVDKKLQRHLLMSSCFSGMSQSWPKQSGEFDTHLRQLENSAPKQFLCVWHF